MKGANKDKLLTYLPLSKVAMGSTLTSNYALKMSASV